MNNEHKLQVATDALKSIQHAISNHYADEPEFAAASLRVDEAIALLAATSTEQPTATAGGLHAKILALRPTSTLIAHADSYRVGFAKCQELAAELARIAQAAPAGDAVEVLQVYRGGYGWHDVGINEYIGTTSNNRRRLYAEPPAATERAATQPAGEALYAVIYDDADMRPAIVIGEEAARATFKRIGGHGYNAHLFVKLESNSRDDQHYNRNLAAPISEDAGKGDDIPPLTMSVYGSLDAIEAERARRTAPDLSAQQPAAASVGGELLALLDGYARDASRGYQHYYEKVAAWGAQQREAGRDEQAKYAAHLANGVLKSQGEVIVLTARAEKAEKERDDLRARVEAVDAVLVEVTQERDAASAQLARPADLAGLTPVFWFDDGSTFSVRDNGLCSITVARYGARGKYNNPLYTAADVQAMLAGGA